MFLPLSLVIPLLLCDCMISLELILYETGNCCSMLAVSHLVNLTIKDLSESQPNYVYLFKQ